MTVTFKGSLTLGSLMPDLQTALTSAQDYLIGSDSDKDLKTGILDEFESQMATLNKRANEVDAKVQEFRNLVNQGIEISNKLQGIVDNLGDNLSKAGVYAYTISGSSVGELGSQIQTAVLQNGAGSEDNLTPNQVVAGTLIIAVDGGAISAIKNVIKIF